MPLIRRRALAGLVAVGAVALIAGCGGGGSGSTSNSSALSAGQFRTQADAICADANRELGALTEPSSAGGVLPYLRAGLPIQASQLNKLRALQPPADLKATFDEAIALLDKRQALTQSLADKIAAGTPAEQAIAAANTENEQLRTEAKAKAKALSLTVCGTDPGTGSTTEASTTTAPAETGSNAQYLADVQKAAAALQGFGSLLQGTQNLTDLKSRVAGARAKVDTFDAAVAKLSGYHLTDATLEKQRSELARTGPQASAALRQFLDAAEGGDVVKITAAGTKVAQALGAFQQAAQP